MVVPHAPDVGVSPQREDLTYDGHPAQRTVDPLHDFCVTHLLRQRREDGVGGFMVKTMKRNLLIY